MRARTELRGRWSAALALTLVIGVFAGVVMTAAAGARRTDTAYTRFLKWSHAPDAGVSIGNPFGTAFGIVGLSREKLDALPEVASSAVSDSFNFVSSTQSGRDLFIGMNSGTAPPRTSSSPGPPSSRWSAWPASRKA